MYLQRIRFNLDSAMPYEHLGYNVMYVTLNNFRERLWLFILTFSIFNWKLT